MAGEAEKAADAAGVTTGGDPGADAAPEERAKWLKLGAGIGSAALLAALLYAQTNRPKSKGQKR